MMHSNKTHKSTTMKKATQTRSANGGTVETFYKSASGSGQLALYPKNTWNAEGDAPSDATPTAMGGNTPTPSPTIAVNNSTGGCGCHTKHKHAFLIGGVALGVLIGWLITKKSA